MIKLYDFDTKYTLETINSGKWIDGYFMNEFQEKLKEYFKVDYIILTNSGTSALFAAYMMFRNLFELDTLLIDPYTFPASYAAAKVAGYKIVFCNVFDSKKRNRLLKNDVSLKTIVHLFGKPQNIVLDINIQNNFLLEDACQSFGAELRNKKVGTIGSVGVFSFYPTKVLHTCGHGGAIITNNEDFYYWMKAFVECGRIEGKFVTDFALNLRMDEIKAEYLLKEFSNIFNEIENRRYIANEYKKCIPDTVLSEQIFLKENRFEKHIYSVFNLLVEERDKFRSFFFDRGIETMVYYTEEILPKKLRKQYKFITDRIVAIPCRGNLKDKEIKYICTVLKEWFGV